jgi:butyrate kinase
MNRKRRLLVINVGSTSTKVACFAESEPVADENIRYRVEDLAGYSSLAQQLPRREADVSEFLEKNRIALDEIDMIVSRGGLGKPAPAGAYGIDAPMCSELLEGKYGKHPSALGPCIARSFARQFGLPAIVVDPPSTDEFEPLARVSGIPEIERKSAFHALNQKIAARKYAAELGKRYEEINTVVARLGGGITVGAHLRGRVVDCTHGLSEGPFTPERAGALPTLDLLDLALARKSEPKQLQKRLAGQGGLAAYLETTDALAVEHMVKEGNGKARLIFEAMAYQIAKDIGAMSVVLKGRIDGIILTGGLAHSGMLTDWVTERIQFLAPVRVYPGEDEMAALAQGGLRVLQAEEEIKTYGQESPS